MKRVANSTVKSAHQHVMSVLIFPHVSSGKRKVEIMELRQLEKDYLLLDARLRLIRKNPDPALASGRCRVWGSLLFLSSLFFFSRVDFVNRLMGNTVIK